MNKKPASPRTAAVADETALAFRAAFQKLAELVTLDVDLAEECIELLEQNVAKLRAARVKRN